ncbi:glycosyltransferase family 4 protein [Flavobacterium sp.]|uniref:glycosyltransferase family 4 protein n=1 Tax=Flavobacterium sp. TaxID=239 RepID=UPI003D0C0051
MKIGYLTSEFPSEKFGASGGIGTSIVALCKGLLSVGHKPVVLLYNQPNDEVVLHEGITFYCIKNVKVKGLSWWLTRKKIEKLINDLFEKGIIELVEAPDWTGITSFIQPNKCPIVIRLNGSDTYFCHLDHRPVKFWNKFHEKRALKKADGHISVSQFTANMTNELFGLKIPFVIIPNGIDPECFKPNPQISEEQDTVLYFGTLIRKKGLLELPLIFNQIIEKRPQTKLVLIGRDSRDIISGENSTWEMMKRLFTSEAMKKVSYLGGIPYNKIQEYINKASVCVFPTFAEALPLSWLEAMAMGKAVVASNIGWGPEVIDSGNEGLLVNPKEHTQYAHAILKLLENPRLKIDYGKNAAQKVVNKFSNAIVVEKSIAFYNKFIN